MKRNSAKATCIASRPHENVSTVSRMFLLAMFVQQFETAYRTLQSLPRKPMQETLMANPPVADSTSWTSCGWPIFFSWSSLPRIHRGYPIVVGFRNDPTSEQVTYECRQIFESTGVPTTFRSNNGPQFAAASFNRFLDRWGITFTPTPPHYPLANYAEVYVKLVKNMLKKLDLNDVTSKEFCEALMELRNTPRADGRSPNEIVFGHNLYSKVPIHHTSFDIFLFDASCIKIGHFQFFPPKGTLNTFEVYHFPCSNDRGVNTSFLMHHASKSVYN